PAIAITISNVTTSAGLGTGVDPALTGALTATATQTASVTTNAGAVATGAATAAVGVGLALTFANHLVQSITSRNLSAAAVTLQAFGSSWSSATAAASASGVVGNATPGGQPGSGVDALLVRQRGFADQVAQQILGSGSGSVAAPSAQTVDGQVSVAAAIGLNIANATSQAGLAATPAGLTLTAGG